MKISQQLETLKSRVSDLKRRRPRALTEEQKGDILMLYHQLQIEDLEHQQKHPERKKRKGNYQPRVAQLLRYSKHSVSSAYAEWRQSQNIVVAVPAANRSRKKERIPRSKRVLQAVRELVREKRARKERVVARHVWDLMRQRGWLLVNEKDPKACASSLRAVQRYLQRRGFRRGATSTAPVKEKESLVLARARYLQRLADNEALPPDQRLRIVDLDESYIHHHYKRHGDSLFDPTDSTPQPRAQHKGQRYCFVAAIQSANPCLRIITDAKDKAGLVPKSVWIFKSQTASGDYHKNFNGANFAHWFKTQLIPNLHQPSLIRLDNAAYHSTRPSSAPKASRMKKADFLRVLAENNIPCTAKETLPILREKLRQYLSTVDAEIVAAARSAGHEVLFTPQYHCDLQPIELVWSQVKGEVGRQYDEDTTLEVVLRRLQQAFNKLEKEPHRVQRLYDHVRKIEASYRRVDDSDDDDASLPTSAAASDAAEMDEMKEARDDMEDEEKRADQSDLELGSESDEQEYDSDDSDDSDDEASSEDEPADSDDE